jgi:GNAT superfamily N-acetyltransferase
VDDAAFAPGIINVDASRLRARNDEFVDLLDDAVAAGASVGYLLPVPSAETAAYWRGIPAEIETGRRVLLACERDGRIVGTVQVSLCAKPNGGHRADVEKLLVLRSVQRQGIGGTLMRAAENVARAHSRSLLLLDTRKDSASEKLYLQLGWRPFGVVDAYARDPDGALARCVFFVKHLEGLPT